MHPVVADRNGLLLYLLAWLLLGVLLALPTLGADLGSWHHALLLFLPPYLFFAFLCLAAWYPCRANPMPATGPGRLVTVHLSAAVVSSLLWWVGASLWTALLTSMLSSGATLSLRPEAARFLALGMLHYLLVATVHYLLQAFEASRRARQRTLELRVLAREAELAAFKSQIDPHFLFNCLNSISSLCGSNPGAARQMAIRLGDFLRASLHLAERDFIDLEQEVEMARDYLEIERVRFGDRLALEDRIEPEALAFRVPALVLQPLLENAIKHGLAHLVEGGMISLSARTVGDRLEVSVGNPVDPESTPSQGDGIGLSNVSGRLDLLYRQRAKLRIDRQPDAFEVTLDLPTQIDQEPTTP